MIRLNSLLATATLAACLVVGARAGTTPQGSAFTYQGVLSSGGDPANGPFDFRFSLWDNVTGGGQLGLEVQLFGVPVIDGVFSAELDFGKPVFNGEARWLQIAVSEGGPFVTLLPRQRVMPAPTATFAVNASEAKPTFRVWNPGSDARATLFFGETDDCNLGIDPQLPGLLERDPFGFRLLGQDEQGCRLIFGPTFDCRIEVDPDGPVGLLLRDPSGIRLVNPDPELPIPTRLRFGPTDDCTVQIDPLGPAGLQLRDPSGVRVLNPDPTGVGPTRLLFGPTDDCRIEINPIGPAGLRLYDPTGIRICRPPSPFPGPIVLFFGDDDLCRIGVNPEGPGGLTASDPAGFRLVNPLDPLRVRFRFGETDDCGFEINPDFPGLIERDVVGLRLLDPSNIGGRILFGPTEDCTIDAGLAPEPGLRLRDPAGVRIVNPFGDASALIFGSTNDCQIKAGGGGGAGGMNFNDPIGFRFNGGFAGFNFPEPTVGIQLPPVPGPVGIGLAVAWETYSSRRFKENIAPISDPLGLIARLQGVRFDWIDSGRHDVGFIAEDVALVLPEVVAMEPDGVNARSIDYGRLTAIAIEGIKAQQDQIDALRAENAALHAELDELRGVVEALAKRCLAETGR